MRIRTLIACFGTVLLAAMAAGPTASPAASAPAKAVGTLVVAVDATTAPYAFVDADGHTVQGLDADIARALASVLGYRLRVIDVRSAEIVPGLVSGDYDLGMSLTETRAGERVVDFVSYLSAGTAFYVKAAGRPSIRKPADLCGRSVAVVRGTAQAAAAAAQSATCRAAGKPAVKILALPDADSAELALSSGRAQVGMADSAVASYTVKQSHGRLRLAGPISGKAVRAIAVARQEGLGKDVLDALGSVIDDGTYATILARWGAQAGAIATPRINPATG